VTAATLPEHATSEALGTAARFDERNGSTAYSDRVRRRMAAEPVTDGLPLGVAVPPLESTTDRTRHEPGTEDTTGAGTATVHAVATLLDQGQNAEAEAALRAVLDDPEQLALLSRYDRARLHHLHGIALSGLEDRTDDVAVALLEATRWTESAGESALIGAEARLRLGELYADSYEHRQMAAAVLESALADLEREHSKEKVVGARVALAKTYGTGHPSRAADQYLLAADLVRELGDHRRCVELTHEGGRKLSTADMKDEAGEVFKRAAQASLERDDIVSAVRIMWNVAWTLVVPMNLEPAEEAGEEVLREIETAVREATDDMDDDYRASLKLALGESYREMADLRELRTGGHADELIMADLEAAISTFRECGDAGIDGWLKAEIRASWLEYDAAMSLQGDFETAMTRCRRVMAEIRALPDPDKYKYTYEYGQMESRLEAAEEGLS
jgi:hypothetical protein